jgi:pimeloyl-ACP methyl ester carboxylesterase/predicted small secreted protein
MRMKSILLTIILVLAALLLSACTASINSGTDINGKSTMNEPGNNIFNLPEAKYMQKVSFITQDNVKIFANSWPGTGKAVLLLHMMPSTKESWNDLAPKLQRAGFSVLAIDLRGHGESTLQTAKTLDYKQFSDLEHQESIKDVESSIAYLTNQGASEIYIIGASIGANLALEYAAMNPEIQKIVLLSPGLDYRGIKGEDYARQLLKSQQVLVYAGRQDMQGGKSAAEMAGSIVGVMLAQNTAQIYETSAHGTNLLTEYPALMNDIIDWLNK